MRVALMQCGGPSPVLNASLGAACRTCLAAGAEVCLVLGGPAGLVGGRLQALRPGLPAERLLRDADRPGALLGAGRLPWGPPQAAAAQLALAAAGVDALLAIGGNGTMALLESVARGAPRLAVLGAPKTVDNDLEGTDRAPGFRSAASFVARAFRALWEDLRAMRGFEDVRLVEVMGRRGGWLAAAAVAGCPEALVVLPEVPLDVQAFLARVAEQHRAQGSVLVAVAEGARDAAGTELGAASTDASGRTAVYSGAAQVLALHLRRALGLRVRAESLGFLPRCFAATPGDRREAEATAAEAARLALRGEGGLMVGIEPDGGLRPVPLASVAGRERPLPPAFRPLGRDWLGWLRPLLEEPDGGGR